MPKFPILIVICACLLFSCTRAPLTRGAITTPTLFLNATIAALSTDVASQGTLIAYLATVVDAQRAGTPTPVGFVPAPTPWWTPTVPSAISSIEFRRTGGIVGLDDQLLVDDRGHAKLTRRVGKFEFDLTQDELTRLRTVLRDASFATIPENSRKALLVPDEISYVITYQSHTVRTSDTSIPEKLQPVIQVLNGIADSKGR